MQLGKIKAIIASTALTISAQSDDLVSAFNMVNQARAERFVKPLSWSSDLAAYAQLWANLMASSQVPFQHAAGAYRPSQGEVLYVQSASGCHPSYDAPFQSAMRAWLAQAPLYDDKPIVTGHEPWLHWSQCMWLGSTEIGCARAYSISEAYKIFVVCRFNPEGNVLTPIHAIVRQTTRQFETGYWQSRPTPAPLPTEPSRLGDAHRGTHAPMMERAKPQAFQSSYAPRLRAYNNSLLTPVLPSAPSVNPLSRTTKRGTTVINYAEDGYDDLEDDSDDPRRRPTGLRSLRLHDSKGLDWSGKAGKDTLQPVHLQPIWRDWMGKTRSIRSDQQTAAQSNLPLTLIPIRIDLDVPSFVPQPPFPPPNTPGVDLSLPQYRQQELTVPYKLRDIFCWNLHETLITTDQFAQTLAQDLDLPNRQHIAADISKQIRTQLEEYAGVALHPLFHSDQPVALTQPAQPAVNATTTRDRPLTRDISPYSAARFLSRADTPAQAPAATPATPVPGQASGVPAVTAEATAILPDSDDFNPDDTYRCIINLNLNMSSMLYTDKFEWSLLHPPGTAELFAKTTCADLGLHGEWVPAMTHAIYEAVLRLKKEACEVGGLVTGWGGLQQELPNDAALGTEAGWRYDPDHLAEDWEPKIEILSKEEMEKREGDRERQVRRLRRETARFSSTTGMLTGTPFGGAGAVGAPATPYEPEEERMGRGERSKKKRRFRSLSPLGRGGTPGGRGTPDAGGYGGGGALTDAERFNWRCLHCRIWGSSVWAVRDGPAGPRTLCANCGLLYERDRKLPRQTKNLHLQDVRAG